MSLFTVRVGHGETWNLCFCDKTFGGQTRAFGVFDDFVVQSKRFMMSDKAPHSISSPVKPIRDKAPYSVQSRDC
ncbi:hypothetical protein M8J77_019733 [Diaphorina citri]|nr:hypothetical protein M8J77_019733 [Diaphorina citri]